MTPAEFRAALQALGVTQGAAAALLGVSLDGVNAWCNGRRPVPAPVARLVRLLARRPELVGDCTDTPPERA